MTQVHRLIREALPSFMSDSEILTVLLGLPPERTKPLAAAVPIAGMGRMSFSELKHAAGLTDRQTSVLIAAATFGRRTCPETDSLPTINCPEDVVNLMSPELDDKLQEELHVLLLNTRNVLQTRTMLYRGNVNSTVARPAEILRPAVVSGQPNMIMVHNHPSGDPTASGADVTITRDVADAATLLGVNLIDHIITAPRRRFRSMKEAQLFEQPARPATSQSH